MRKVDSSRDSAPPSLKIIRNVVIILHIILISLVIYGLCNGN